MKRIQLEEFMPNTTLVCDGDTITVEVQTSWDQDCMMGVLSFHLPNCEQYSKEELLAKLPCEF